MGLNGIDVSSWQEDLVVGNMTTCDFVIVKATGGKGYRNGCFKKHAEQTLAADKLLGCYHYARDHGYEGAAIEEADWFGAAFEPYTARRYRSWTGRPTRWRWGPPGRRCDSTA